MSESVILYRVKGLYCLITAFLLAAGCSPAEGWKQQLIPIPSPKPSSQIDAMDVLTPGCRLEAEDSVLNGWISVCDASVKYYLANNYSEKTGLVYTTTPDKVRSSADCVNGMFHWYQGIPGGYGNGMGDCALIEGTILSGMVQKWKAVNLQSEKEELRAQASKITRGLFNLAELHGIKGFVARGICADDGKSICSLTSIDQYTHWEHGLWQYANSGMATDDELAEYRRLVVEVARFMEERVTEENGWNFGLADGTIPDPRGICTLWGDKKPHAAARLLMIYCAAYLATGDTHWRDMYETYVEKSIEMTLVLKQQSEATVDSYPCYSLYQAMCSLELVLSYENDPVRRAKLEECMAEFSRRAHIRLEKSNPSNPPYGMCWDGELILTTLMDPSYEMTASDSVFLEETMKRSNSTTMGWCRCAHVYSALWRYVNYR